MVGTQINTVSHFDQPMYLLGYLSSYNRIVVCDKHMVFYKFIKVISTFSLPLTLIEYQTAVLRGDLAYAEKVLPSVPVDQRNRIARFLETQDLKELALEISSNFILFIL